MLESAARTRSGMLATMLYLFSAEDTFRTEGLAAGLLEAVIRSPLAALDPDEELQALAELWRTAEPHLAEGERAGASGSAFDGGAQRYHALRNERDLIWSRAARLQARTGNGILAKVSLAYGDQLSADQTSACVGASALLRSAAADLSRMGDLAAEDDLAPERRAKLASR